jgi:hypothetical protein
MGSMSASDAAPLPRLGEVYFDVRGESRSMRLSWYADTGVAVFSIWQGGTCTGTFRLPIADLPRMIDTLQRGPHGDARDPAAPQDGPGQSSGDYGPGDAGGYGRTAAHGRYEQEIRAVYPDDSLPGTGGYGGERGDRYEDEPTGIYRGDLLSQDHQNEPGDRHRDDPLTSSYGEEPPAGGHRADPHDGGHSDDPLGGYQDGPHTGSYREDPLGGGYRDDPLGGGHSDDSRTSGYQADPLGGGYHADSPSGGYHADSPSGGYQADSPSGGYQADSLSGGYREGSRSGGRRRAGEYPDDRHSGGFPGEYAEEAGTARYGEEPSTGDYPTGPWDPAIDDEDYPAPAGNAGYSPARPYVAPLPGGGAGAREGRGRQRRRPGTREESDPSPDSFPYGRSSAEPEVHERGR